MTAERTEAEALSSGGATTEELPVPGVDVDNTEPEYDPMIFDVPVYQTDWVLDP